MSDGPGDRDDDAGDEMGDATAGMGGSVSWTLVRRVDI